MFNPSNFSDEKILQLCKKYGSQAKLWRARFTGLLPEVNRRRLYEQKGYTSIFVFAAQWAGLSVDQVRLVLNMEPRFQATPALKSLLVEGKVSVNKLARVVSVATPKNQEFLAEQVQLLSKSAVEVLARDMRRMANQNGLNKEKNSTRGLPGQTLADKLSQLKLSEELVDQLLELQCRGLSIEALIQSALDLRSQKIAEKKAVIARELPEESSRSMPRKVSAIIKEEHGEKCSIQFCMRPSQALHHTRRWALQQNHDPHFIAPLCKEHHQIAHAIDVRVSENRFAANTG